MNSRRATHNQDRRSSDRLRWVEQLRQRAYMQLTTPRAGFGGGGRNPASTVPRQRPDEMPRTAEAPAQQRGSSRDERALWLRKAGHQLCLEMRSRPVTATQPLMSNSRREIRLRRERRLLQSALDSAAKLRRERPKPK